MNNQRKDNLLRGLVLFLGDNKSDWKPKIIAVLALLYIAWPLDLVPDIAPLIGWLDDLGLAALATWYLLFSTRKYLNNKDRQP